MNLKSATLNDQKSIYNLVQKTIKEVYSKYYPAGVVEFFGKHHSEENIKADIEKGMVYVIEVDGDIVATGTVYENHITRLFVLPEFQGKGYGTYLMNLFETKIFQNYGEIILDASLPASKFYEKRDYKHLKYEEKDCENGCFLLYEVLNKVK